MAIEERSAGVSRHILVTGGSSGIGFQAAKLLLQAGHHLTIPCRDRTTATLLRTRLSGRIDTPTCDLSDLSSIERCAESLLAGGAPIDTLVLNAGLQYSGIDEPRWSAQGFELTIAVNHLGHQVLMQKLLPLLIRGTTPRLVVTASEVHDPNSAGGKVGLPAGLGDLAGLRQGPGALMLDGSDRFNAEKAYKDSKLCNLLMARETERRLREQGTLLPVVAWSPGLVIPRGKGGFFRYSRCHNPIGQTLFAVAARDLLRLTETPQRAGALLAGLADGSKPQASGFSYWRNRVVGPGQLRFEVSQPSQEACSNPLAFQLWDLSAKISRG